MFILLKELKQDAVVLGETTEDVIPAIQMILPGAKVEETLPVIIGLATARAGTTVITEKGDGMRLE